MDDDLTWHAVESKKQFDELIELLIRLAGQNVGAASLEDREALTRAENEVEFDAYELSEVLSKFESPVDRGDAFIFATRLIEVAFTVGQLNESDEARRNAHRLLSKLGGQTTGGLKRNEAEESWRKAFRERFADLRRDQPHAPTTRLCGKAYQGEPEGFENACRYIRSQERDGSMPKKQKRH